jgi:hypothetical protein
MLELFGNSKKYPPVTVLPGLGNKTIGTGAF